MHQIYREIKPIAFHCYPSVVINPFLKLDDHSSEIIKFRDDLIVLFNKAGIKDRLGGFVNYDNKIVFELEVDGTVLFYGFKDGFFSVGFKCMEY